MSENRITLRGISSETLQKLDVIVKQEQYQSRSDLICEILDSYVADKDNFILNHLPSIVRSMVEQEIKRVSNNSDEVLNDIYRACLRLIRVTQKFENFLYPELLKTDSSDLNNEQLLAILDTMDNEKQQKKT